MGKTIRKMKTRIIHTIFWKKMVRVNAPKDARYLFSYLLDNEYINMSGVFLLDDFTIMNETRLTIKELDKAKKWLSDNKKVFFYDGYIKVVNAEEHNGYQKSPKNTKSYKRELRDVPKYVLDYFDNEIDSSINSSINSSMGGIYNHKSEIKNQKSKIKSFEESEKLLPQAEPRVEGGTYRSINQVGELEFSRLAEDFSVPIAFVRSKYDDMLTWCGAKGKSYKNYYLALRNWVKKDALEEKKHAKQPSKYTVSRIVPTES